MTDLKQPEENYCEIINDQCPYDYPCSLCRLRDDYDNAKVMAEKLKDSGRWTARTLS